MNNTPLPGQTNQPEGTMCGSCGRFVGALTRCPYCGARVAKRMSIMVFRYAALFLATVGLGLLYLMARSREIPVVKIGDLKSTMNFAYVRVVGTVSGDARTFKEGDRVRTMRFMVDDGTGEITVNAYRTQAQELVDQDRVPRLGDRVDVAGSLSMSADGDVVMRLQVPEQMTLVSAEMPVTRLGDVTAASVGQSLMVEGEIRRVNAPRPNSRAPWVITLADGSGEQEITFWDTTYAEVHDKMLLKPGTRVRARVSAKTYRDKLQLSLNRGSDLQFPSGVPAAAMTAGPGAPVSDARPVALGDVTADMTGQLVEVSGRVAEVRTPQEGSKAPYAVILQDGDKKIEVVYWDVVARRLEANRPVVGALMKVQGWVGVYRDKIQLKVSHSAQVTLVDVAPASTPAPVSLGEVAIGAIKPEMIGKTCAVRGTLGDPRSVRGGVIYSLSDGEARISLVLWDKNVPGADRDRLAVGGKVVVSGLVQDYKGTLEIVPANAQAIQVEPSP
ncbi:MAG: hypothetical protein V1873_07635 [Verrucomicrobiota bacterium]